MKLAEALIERADLQTRLEQLRERLTMNARVQEGEAPAEDPMVLLSEVNTASIQLEDLIGRINLTNARVMLNGLSLTAQLARREVLTKRIAILRSLLDAASSLTMRGTRSEVKIYSTVDVAALRKQTDDLSRDLRELDTAIQGANWTTDLQ